MKDGENRTQGVKEPGGARRGDGRGREAMGGASERVRLRYKMREAKSKGKAELDSKPNGAKDWIAQ